jgi:hypothetical protein
MKLTAEELNALLNITANAQISGKDAKFVASLIDKLVSLLGETESSLSKK